MTRASRSSSGGSVAIGITSTSGHVAPRAGAGRGARGRRAASPSHGWRSSMTRATPVSPPGPRARCAASGSRRRRRRRSSPRVAVHSRTRAPRKRLADERPRRAAPRGSRRRRWARPRRRGGARESRDEATSRIARSAPPVVTRRTSSKLVMPFASFLMAASRSVIRPSWRACFRISLALDLAMMSLRILSSTSSTSKTPVRPRRPVDRHCTHPSPNATMSSGLWPCARELVHVEAEERHLVGREERLDAARGADGAHEALRDDADERRREDERVDAELEQPRDGASPRRSCAASRAPCGP